MLLKPLVTEKTMQETNSGRFAFAVDPAANKTEVKRAVEKLFGVKVIKIQTAVMPGKSYRLGKRWQRAYKSDWKKAIVTLAQGQKINLFDTTAENK